VAFWECLFPVATFGTRNLGAQCKISSHVSESKKLNFWWNSFSEIPKNSPPKSAPKMSVCRLFSNHFIKSKTSIPSFTPPSLGLWNKCSRQYWPIGASSASQHCRPCPANEVESGKKIFLRIKMQIKIQKIS
jgi:hypothetical protein